MTVETDTPRDAGAEGEIVLRPEAIRIAPEGLLPCTVELSCFMGSYQNYHVRLEDGTLVKITDSCPLNKRVFESASAPPSRLTRTARTCCNGHAQEGRPAFRRAARRLSKNLLGGSEGRSPPSCIPNPATCAVDSEACAARFPCAFPRPR